MAPKEKKKPEENAQGATNPRVADKVNESGPTGMQQGPRKQYGKHATMPVLAADQYAEVILPDLTEFNPDDIKLDGTTSVLYSSFARCAITCTSSKASPPAFTGC